VLFVFIIELRSVGGGCATSLSFSLQPEDRSTKLANMDSRPWNHDKFGGRGRGGAPASAAVLGQSKKLIISNLPDDFAEAELMELFQDFQPIKALMKWDKAGRSTGIGTVEFKNTTSSAAAKKEFHMRSITPLDGSAAAKPITIAFDESGAVTPGGVRSRVVGGRAQRGGMDMD